jgi:allantoicase
LIMPGRPRDAGGGWETRRRRGPGHDWIIVQLGARSVIERIAVETQHFKGNYPDRCSVDAFDAVAPRVEDLTTAPVRWTEILAPTKLGPDSVHIYERELLARAPFTVVRLNIYPDGGVSRLRVFARVAK